MKEETLHAHFFCVADFNRFVYVRRSSTELGTERGQPVSLVL